ncbi:MAG TPA: hypothetical protein DCZ94_02955 [Lentisphaeria bacterium]|nr:MAG: hypothetical protein A2X48_15780 [Lentisphaerae bacterium GWF2_49_21]HBC85893.1 hypothetical protein [Lentisphaeria bacterium]
MMNGYKNFADDVKLAFDEYLKQGKVSVRYESWFKGEFCHGVILESVSQYLDFHVDSGSLVVSIIDKSTLEFMELDDLILFLNPGIDLKGEKSRYFYNSYYEEAKSKGKNTGDLAVIAVKHLFLGELNAYSKIIGKCIGETVFTDKQNWPEKVKRTGKVLYVSKAEGIAAR